MSKIVRTSRVEIWDEEGEELVITIRKWSMARAFAIVREIFDVAKETINSLDFSLIGNNVELALSVLKVLLEKETLAASVVRRSLIANDQEHFSEEKLLDLDAECFLKVLREVLNLNINEEIVKNCRGLFTDIQSTIVRKKQEVDGLKDSSGGETEEHPASES